MNNLPPKPESAPSYEVIKEILRLCRLSKTCGKIEIPLRDGLPLEDHIMLKVKAKKILNAF